ncbi:MAG: SIMPL domain-containing protein [Prosthecobacter sp.]|jgi:uncharacterized protein YggE|uniref:SIMPL domain-containing protein n=1 Tax=Prosthecobacter sp. TaxID=1965333 RepID=UPI0019F733F7|nr:SIMPL domain-containing protein [Prosthecobacter sp.]MBE2287696.1 SIMPL domain-containing protein [Prosthecobacter sp.]
MKAAPSLIRVQGKGLVSSNPDTVILTLDIESEHKQYAKAMEDAATRLELLRQALADVGLEAEMLKTNAFGVSVAQDYREGRHIFRGYTARHGLSLELPYDRAKVGRVFEAVTGSKAKAGLSLTFTVADREAVKRRVLEAAVRNARERAEVIAQAAGRKLGRIHAIEHGDTVINVRSQNLFCGTPVESRTALMTFAPAEIVSEDTVLITWDLED